MMKDARERSTSPGEVAGTVTGAPPAAATLWYFFIGVDPDPYTNPLSS